MSRPTLFHSLGFADARAAMSFLEAVGFTRVAVHTDESDPSVVVHAQYNWGDCGAIMFGSTGRPDRGGLADSAGHARCYCVVATDEEVDAVHEKAVAAGAATVRAPEDQDYGGRSCTITDPEGNEWSFGSYPGE
jgi:uncharacterized glyoxalase superfamily protein PhnB